MCDQPNDPAAALRVAVAEALADDYSPEEIRAEVEFELRAQALGYAAAFA